jgi:hypothetical protein
LDLAAARQSGTVSVLLGLGDGTFRDKLDYAAADSPVSVAMGDVDGDGKLDLAVVNEGLSALEAPIPSTVSVLLNSCR